MSTDLKDLTDDELVAEWEQANAAYESHYWRCRAAYAGHVALTSPPLKQYNAIRADEARTAEWRRQCDESHEKYLKMSEAGNPLAAKRDAYAAEWERRGNKVHYPRIEALKRQLKGGKS